MIRSIRFACVVAATLAPGCVARDTPAPVVQHTPASRTAAAPSSAENDGAVILIRPGDTLYRLAKREGIPARALAEANGLAPPYLLKVGQTLRVPEQGVYIVQRGDTFASIAVRHGREAWALALANGVKPPYEVHAGQRLVIPGSAPSGAFAVASAAAPAAAPQAKAGTKALAVRAAPIRPPQDEPVSTLTVPAAPRSTVEATPLGAPTPVKAEAMRVQPAVAVLETPRLASQVAARSAEPPVSARAEEEEEETARPKGASRARILSAEPSARLTPAVARPPGLSGEPPARAGRHFAWPVKGKLISSFGPQPGGLHNDGLNIAAGHGAQVTAAENGVVAYAGADLKGFGNLLLIKHAGGFVTAYAHNDKLLVKRGDTVRRGQPIATVGDSGAVTRPQVHFQVRQGAHPVDPRPLMERSS